MPFSTKVDMKKLTQKLMAQVMTNTHKAINPLLVAVILGLIQMTFAGQAFACDTDAECGTGGTCIKREKRARGVCYGGNLGAADDTQPTPQLNSRQTELSLQPSTESSTKQPTNLSNATGDLPIYGEEGYVEPSAQPRMIDRLDVPERTDSACVTSTDCSGGQECIYRDPMLGHGLCEAPP